MHARLSTPGRWSTLFLLLSALLVALPQATTALGAWYNGNWAYRAEVTVDPAKVGDDLTDFPVYLDLGSMPSSFFDKVQPGGGELRVTTKAGAEVPREVVSLDPVGGTGELHFLAPNLSGSSDTSFYVYYGNASASDYGPSETYGSENVWNDDYVLVQHLEESPSGSGGTHYDSTSNSNDGTTNNGVTTNATGKMYGADNFNGSYIAVPDNASLDFTDALTVEAWIYPDAMTYYGGLVDKIGGSSPSSNGDGWLLRHDGGGTMNLIAIEDGTPWYGDDADVSLSTEAWQHVVGRYDGSVIKVLRDGGALAGGTEDSTTSAILSSLPVTSYQVNIGSYGYEGHSSHTAYPFKGTMDEVRISQVARSDEWIFTAYNNQYEPGTFYSLGALEPIPEPASLMIFLGLGAIGLLLRRRKRPR